MEVKVECTSCKKKFILSEEEVKKAQELGCATCNKCYSVAVVISIKGRIKKGL